MDSLQRLVIKIAHTIASLLSSTYSYMHHAMIILVCGFSDKKKYICATCEVFKVFTFHLQNFPLLHFRIYCPILPNLANNPEFLDVYDIGLILVYTAIISWLQNNEHHQHCNLVINHDSVT